MATLEKLTRLSEPSIQGAQAVRKIVKDAEDLLKQSKRDHVCICETHPKLAFLISDSHTQLKLCASLESNLRQHLADLESTTQLKEQQADDLRQEMATIIELLKDREVVENEFRSPHMPDSESGEVKKHTLYDHIDQEAVDALQVRVNDCLNELRIIGDANHEQCAQALRKIDGIIIPAAEDISVTWEGVEAIGKLVDESQSAAEEIAQDVQSIDHHCDQLRDTIRDMELEGGVLSMDDYNVLLRDTNEVSGIVADLDETLAGVRRRADEINVRFLQYSAFYDESTRRFAAVAQIAEIGQQYVQDVASEQMQYAALASAVDTALEDMWGLVSWYRQFHSAYDGLIAEVHRRRQAQRELLGAIEDMRARLDAVHVEELRVRAAFVDREGPFLPSDLCPFIQDPPPRYTIEEAGDAGRFASVQSHETRYSKHIVDSHAFNPPSPT
ncbi:hypothetical protein IW142_001821 [Coemansia sp. RSA 564]|nr:hypothetical protein IW142_001821 [Coemansia sp. RSA 564]